MFKINDMRYLTKEEQSLYNEDVKEFFKNFKIINIPLSKWEDVEL